MFAAKQVAGQPMVEVLVAIFPKHQLEIAAVMLDVAILTFTVFGLLMQSPPVLNACAHFAVACQALDTHLIRIAVVTSVAILNSLQKGMRPMQVSRGQLGVCMWADSECHHESKDDNSKGFAHGGC
jgi:hypothetical protein